MAKQAIRNMLPLGLKESISKVRNTVAFSLAGEFMFFPWSLLGGNNRGGAIHGTN